MTKPSLTVISSPIRQLDNLYSLNDLHKAAGSEPKHQPALFMRNDQTQELIQELSSTDSQTIHFKTVVGKGKQQGTYVCKELVYSYAMWISAKFQLIVVRAFDALASATKAPNLKTKTTLPNGLTADQCDAIKALVKARAESCPKEKQGAAAIKCWSSIKSKFGCGYKEISPEHFTDALSLVARIELEGEYLPKQELPPADVAASLSISEVGASGLSLSDDIRKAISTKAFSLAQEAFELSVDHLTQRVAYEHGTSIKRGAANKDDVIATINAGTLGYALTYKMHDELERIVNQAAGLRYMATQLEEKIRGSKPQLSAP